MMSVSKLPGAHNRINRLAGKHLRLEMDSCRSCTRRMIDPISDLEDAARMKVMEMTSTSMRPLLVYGSGPSVRPGIDVHSGIAISPQSAGYVFGACSFQRKVRVKRLM